MKQKEFAHMLAEYLRSNPKSIHDVVYRIRNATVDNKPISKADINQILSYMDEELGRFTYIEEQKDYTVNMTLMQQIHALLDGN